jgi:uncharacterized membrane protein YphA (DoxX/SURF4 family)
MTTTTTTFSTFEENSIELITRLRAPDRTSVGGEFPSAASLKEGGANAMRKVAGVVEEAKTQLREGGAQQIVGAVEDTLEAYLTKKARSQFLAKAGPTLLCLTFLDDGLRIPLRWSEQHGYMVHSMGMLSGLASIVLVASALTQLFASWFILRPIGFQPSRVKAACYSLLAFVVLQPFLYGQVYDLDFICRSSTVAGGLLLLIWGENEKEGRRNDAGLGLLGGAAEDRSADRLQLAGRLLLTFMFLFQAVFSREGGLHSVVMAPSVFNVGSSCALLALSLMVCLGFKAEWSSLVLTIVLGVANFFLYPFWSAEAHLSDYLRYYFFQTLSIMGGLMLLTLHGPGGLSLDGQKKKL